MEQPISTRLQEEKKRPGLYLAAESAFDRAKQWAVSMAASRPTSTSSSLSDSDDAAPPSRFSEDEISAFDKLHSETRTWFAEQRKLQDGKKLWEDPVLRSREAEGKLKFLESEVARLEKRKPPRRRPKPTASSSSKKDPIVEAMEALNLTMADLNNLTAGADSDGPTTTSGGEHPETTAPDAEQTQGELKHEEL